MNLPDVTLEQAADLLSMSPAVLAQHILAGQVPLAVHISVHLRRDDVLAYKAARSERRAEAFEALAALGEDGDG